MIEVITGEYGFRETEPKTLPDGRVLKVYERPFNSLLTMSLPTSWPYGYDNSY